MNVSNSKPAILGGPKAVTKDAAEVNAWPRLGPEEEQAVLAVLRDGDISTHGVARELEADYAAYCGRQYALSHNNGTSALLAAYRAVGLQPGDEVLAPSATFWASVLPILWLGAVPVFCESEDERLGIDPADMARKITPRTKAVAVVHLWGLPSKMTEIRAVAAAHGLKIVEDASHAHGAAWRNVKCGALGDVSVFSLQGDKLAPAGEGGMLLTDNYDYYESAICLGDITRITQLDTPAQRFAATSFGVKTRIAPLCAAVGRVQLQKLDANNRTRNRNLTYLSQGLEELGFHCFLPPEHIERVYFEFIVRPEDVPVPMDVLVGALGAEGIEASAPRYPLLHQQPFFTEGHFADVLRLGSDAPVGKYRADDLPATAQANGRLLKLPSFPNNDNGILDQYLAGFRKVLRHADEIANNAAKT